MTKSRWLTVSGAALFAGLSLATSLAEASGTLSADPDYQALYDGVADRLVWADPVGHEPLWRDPDVGISLDVYRAWLGDDPEWVVGGTLAGFAPDLEAVAAPALVITGRWDGMLTPALAGQLHARLPAAQLQVFEQSAHRPWAEEPDAYFAALADFLG